MNKIGGIKLRVQLFVVILLTFVFLAGTSVNAQYFSDIDSLRVVSATCSGGDTLTIPIYLANSFAVGAFFLRISFDNNAFVPLSVSLTDRSSQFDLNGFNFLEPGIVSILGSSWDPITHAIPSGAGPIENVTFLVAQNAAPGTYSMIFQDRDSTSHENSLSNSLGDSLVIPILIPGQIQIISTGIEDEIPQPHSMELAQNYPNPFNNETSLSFYLEKSETVNLVIYDILGNSVRSLFNGTAPAGKMQLIWDGKNDNGVSIASGIYFYNLKSMGGNSVTKSMTLLK